MVDLPAPDGPTMATVLPGRHLEEMPFRIGRVGIVVEARHRRSAPPRRRPTSGARVRLVDDLRGHVEQVEHRLDVDQALLDLAIDEADEIQRDRQLHQQRVDQHEIADRLLAAHDGGADMTMQMVMPMVKMTIWPMLSQASEVQIWIAAFS